MRMPSLFEGDRLTMEDSIELTVASLAEYGPRHDHWAIAWSGGKDSTATLTLIVDLIEQGRIARPKTLSVFYADTRQELPPLAIAAESVVAHLRLRAPWIRVEIVMAPLDKRFLVYILGRGVPPPNNNTLRWCTRQIKVDPMAAALEASLPGIDGKVLMITGVRQGESAIRDRRIQMSCGKDGAECGQGWYQLALPNAKGVRGRVATLAPLLHWRVCHVWDWLRVFAPSRGHGFWPTIALAEAYGGDEAEEINARTGCTGCPLASRERALDAILAQPQWSYLAPLKGLKPLYRELREPRHRLRQPGGETRQDGSLVKNQQRLGPLTFEARLMGLERVLAIQAEVNRLAEIHDAGARSPIDILNAKEEARIRVLIEAGTWPQGWEGDEPTGDVLLPTIYADGSVQPLLGEGGA
jgi:DNA sulfur modification protein DndC